MAAGKKTGGRKKGSLNKSIGKTKADKVAIASSGETPMDYMLRIMRDPETASDRRDRMAAAVSPYVHARLTSIGGTPDKPVEIVVRWAGMK